MTSKLPLVGGLIQLLGLLILLLPLGLDYPIETVSGWSLIVVGCLVCLYAVFQPSMSLGARLFTGLGALLVGIGAGSWVLVSLLYRQDDPVINIAGLLVVPGLPFLLVGLLWDALTGFRKTKTPKEPPYPPRPAS